VCHEQATNLKHQTVMIVTAIASDREIFLTHDHQEAICFQWREA
jgi:hypothetical protein